MDDISHDHHRLPRCNFGYVTAVRSSDVIKSHNNVRMVSLCSASHQDASNDIHVDLEVTLRSRDLRSIVDLNLMRYMHISTHMHISMRMNERISIALLVLF